MKTSIIKMALLVMPFFLITSCSDNDKFEKELYKTQVYLVSGDENVKQLEYSLDAIESTNHISIGYSGTTKMSKNIYGEVKLSPNLIDKYNYSHFDIDEEKYARHFEDYEMPTNKFEIDADVATYGLLSISIKGEALSKLSPDSIYFIPLMLNEVDGYEISEKKDYVLARVYIKNSYASVKDQTTYRSKGYTQTGNGAPSSMSFDKIMHPIAKDKVRIFAGAQNYNASSKSLNRDIKQKGIIITINEDKTLALSPSDPKGEFMELEQLTPPSEDFVYKNILDPDDGSFLLYYKYRSYEYKNYVWQWSDWYTIRERVEKY